LCDKSAAHLFGLSQAVAIKLNIRWQRRRSMFAQMHKPIDLLRKDCASRSLSIATAESGLI
jgi:hypothetical protein